MADEEHVALLEQGGGDRADGSGTDEVMTTDDLLTLRNVLGLRRRALVDRLATDTSGIIEPAYVSLLADTHAAIAAVDAELVEMEGGCVMKLVEAMYGWNRNSDEIDVGPWPDTTGWSDRYSLTGGACYTNIRQMSPDQLAAQIFIDFHMIVLRDGVDVQAAHRAFLKIDEFRGSIAPDVPGADPDGGA